MWLFASMPPMVVPRSRQAPAVACCPLLAVTRPPCGRCAPGGSAHVHLGQGLVLARIQLRFSLSALFLICSRQGMEWGFVWLR